MSPRETDDVSGVETTGHEWDGIRELDNPLPRWWLWTFWLCVGVAIVYWVLMPAWPGAKDYTHGVLNKSDRADVAQQLDELKAIRGAEGAQLKNASLQQIESDPKLQAYALAVGQSIFGDNCATCHGTGGAGGKGYPNLRDDVWIWGGTLEDIQHTIKVGVRSEHPQTRFSQMPAFGRDGIVPADQVNDLTEYVVALSHRLPGQLRHLPWPGRQGHARPGRARSDRRRLALWFGPRRYQGPDLERPGRRHANLGASLRPGDHQGSGGLHSRERGGSVV
jgi:cytochrome c oxidase cbb3-type subunit 3